MENTIITTSTGDIFYINKQIKYNNRKFVLATRQSDSDLGIENNAYLMELVELNGDEILQEIDDDNLCNTLLDLLLKENFNSI